MAQSISPSQACGVEVVPRSFQRGDVFCRDFSNSDVTCPPTSHAKQYAERIDTRIILIDGTELARLMIAYGVGVTPVAVYELKRVDSDFFAEED
jgi:restriction endonuclease Mrr